MTIPLRTFAALLSPNSAAAQTCPIAQGGGSKHSRFTYDGRRNKSVWLGGDWAGVTNAGFSSGNNQAGSYDARNDAWANLSTFCHAAGKNTPYGPDEPPFCYDIKRDRYIGMTWSVTQTNMPATCSISNGASPVGSNYIYGVVAMDPVTLDWSSLASGTPIAPPSIGGVGTHLVYDPVLDRYLTADSDNINFLSPTTFQAVVSTPYRYSFCNPPVAVGDGNVWWQNGLRESFFAIDVLGRKAYTMAFAYVGPSAGDTAYYDVRFFVVNLDTGALSLGVQPPLPTSVPGARNAHGGDGCHPWVLFDPKNRAVIYFASSGPGSACHVISKVYVYKVATAAWESYDVACDTPAAVPVLANTMVWDPKENCAILGGHEFCVSQGQSIPASRYFYRWRYA